VEVRRIRSDEWGPLRAIRLEALADTPTAYITTLADAENFPDDLWRERAEKGAAGVDQATYLAFDGLAPVGMAVGLLRPDIRPDVVPIVSVYVSPSVRRSGVGDALMAGVEEWARTVGASSTSLWVVDGNDAARRFYESLGYRMTLDRQKIAQPPIRWETRLVKDLDT